MMASRNMRQPGAKVIRLEWDSASGLQSDADASPLAGLARSWVAE